MTVIEQLNLDMHNLNIQTHNLNIQNNNEKFQINYIQNNIKKCIRENEKIEEKLNVIICCSNPCQYESRYKLAHDFIKRMSNEENVNLYIVELVYQSLNKDPPIFYITNKNNKNHLQLILDNSPLWHKENILNIGIKKLLPKNWKGMAWIDADIEFDNPHWIDDTLKILNNYDIVQLFSHALDMDPDEKTMSIFSGFGYQYLHKKQHIHGGNPNNQWHPGYAWAMNRKAYDQMNGLFEIAILGSGDYLMAMSWLGIVERTFDNKLSDGYKKSILEYQDKCHGLTLGYVPGVIRHYFHGLKKKRFYNERNQILMKYQFDPYIHLSKTDTGLLIPSKKCDNNMLIDIMNYFISREEDENFNKK